MCYYTVEHSTVYIKFETDYQYSLNANFMCATRYLCMCVCKYKSAAATACDNCDSENYGTEKFN